MKLSTNSADPDLTAPEEQSDQDLHCLHRHIYQNIYVKYGMVNHSMVLNIDISP